MPSCYLQKYKILTGKTIGKPIRNRNKNKMAKKARKTNRK